MEGIVWPLDDAPSQGGWPELRGRLAEGYLVDRPVGEANRVAGEKHHDRDSCGGRRSAGIYLFDIRKSRKEWERTLVQEQTDQQTRRAALATALLLDLRTVETTLRQVYKHPHPTAARWTILPLFFDRVEHEAVIFTPATVAALTGFYTSTREAYTALEVVRRSEGAGSNDHVTWQVRCKAAFALQALADAKTALEAEGGVLPRAKALEPVAEPDVPPLPERYFPLVVDERWGLDRIE